MVQTAGLGVAPAMLAPRLRSVAGILLGAPLPPGQGLSHDAGVLLELLVRAVQSDRRQDRVWLLCTAVFGAYPTADDVVACARHLELATAAEAGRWLLGRATAAEAALAEEHHRAVEQMLREQRAARRAVFAARYPQVARSVVNARRATRQFAVRVPPVRQVARFGRQRLIGARNHAIAAQHRVRRRLGQLRNSARSHKDSVQADLGGSHSTGLRVVADRVVVDVDHSARHDLHTGIQQVVRRSLPFWERDHPVLAVAWTTGWSGLRPLSETERCRVLHWGGPDAPAPGPTSPPGPAGGPSSDPEVLVVPWRTVVVIMETPASQACDRLAALAQYSGNAVVAVGYDCIPVVSADLVPAVETQRFARYLSVLKHARRIAGISRSATTEFRGFGAALPAQGLPGPTIIECPLPTQAVTAQTGTTQTADAPRTTALVLSVGSLEPRKNHLALLYAAERLWRDHLHFELLLIAGSGWGDELPARIAHLQAQGRPLSVRTDVSDAELAAAYRQARFSVFASLHEGYGLPVAESLAYGTPVITTNYGSTGDIAAAGGAILIDPRDDDALTDAMRGLLTDDHRLDSLRHQLHTLPTRTWEHYAHDLWHHLVQPELPCPPTPS